MSVKKAINTKNVKPKSLLLQMIEADNWIPIQARTGASKLPADAISAQFTFKSVKSIKDKENANCDLLRIRLGCDVLKKLDWATGDRIYVSHNPDDQLTFLLCKVSSRNGFKLGKDFGADSASIQLTWPKENLPIKATGSQLVEYEAHKGKLIFRINVAN